MPVAFKTERPFRIVNDQFGYLMFAAEVDGSDFQWSDQVEDAMIFDERDSREDKLAYWKEIARLEGLNPDSMRIVDGGYVARQEVRFLHPMKGEESLRYIMIEDHGPRVLVQQMCNMTIKPTCTLDLIDLVAVEIE